MSIEKRVEDLEKILRDSEVKVGRKSLLMIFDGEDKEAKIAEFSRLNGRDPAVILISHIPRPVYDEKTKDGDNL